MIKTQQSGHGRLTFRAALGLAAPHTWGAASLFPSFLGAVLALTETGQLNLPVFFVLLTITVLMQAAVNTLNDYYDFVKGTDTVENSDDPSDAVLVYQRLNPRHVFSLGMSYLVVSGLLGIFIVYRAGVAPLVIGLIGGLSIVAYSAGKLPLSYLPLGELVSGFVMGGLIPLAFFVTLTGRLDFSVLWKAIPMILGIALVMMTNNTCDIERDAPAGRRTLSVLVGRAGARRVYQGAVLLALLSLAVIGLVVFPAGFFLFPTALPLWASAFFGPLYSPLTPETRGACFGRITAYNEAVDILYLAMILTHTILR